MEDDENMWQHTCSEPQSILHHHHHHHHVDPAMSPPYPSPANLPHDTSSVTIPLSSVEAVSLAEAENWTMGDEDEDGRATGGCTEISRSGRPVDMGRPPLPHRPFEQPQQQDQQQQFMGAIDLPRDPGSTPSSVSSVSEDSNDENEATARPLIVEERIGHSCPTVVEDEVSLVVDHDKSFEEEALSRRLANLRAEVDHMCFAVFLECNSSSGDANPTIMRASKPASRSSSIASDTSTSSIKRASPSGSHREARARRTVEARRPSFQGPSESSGAARFTSGPAVGKTTPSAKRASQSTAGPQELVRKSSMGRPRLVMDNRRVVQRENGRGRVRQALENPEETSIRRASSSLLAESGFRKDRALRKSDAPSSPALLPAEFVAERCASDVPQTSPPCGGFGDLHHASSSVAMPPKCVPANVLPTESHHVPCKEDDSRSTRDGDQQNVWVLHDKSRPPPTSGRLSSAQRQVNSANSDPEEGLRSPDDVSFFSSYMKSARCPAQYKLAETLREASLLPARVATEARSIVGPQISGQQRSIVVREPLLPSKSLSKASTMRSVVPLEPAKHLSNHQHHVTAFKPHPVESREVAPRPTEIPQNNGTTPASLAGKASPMQKHDHHHSVTWTAVRSSDSGQAKAHRDVAKRHQSHNIRDVRSRNAACAKLRVERERVDPTSGELAVTTLPRIPSSLEPHVEPPTAPLVAVKTVVKSPSVSSVNSSIDFFVERAASSAASSSMVVKQSDGPRDDSEPQKKKGTPDAAHPVTSTPNYLAAGGGASSPETSDIDFELFSSDDDDRDERKSDH